MSSMIVYKASKKQFLLDAPDIQDIVRQRLKETFFEDKKPNSSEYRSWQNSLGNAMFHVLNSSSLDDAVTVAIEFGVPFSRNRIDFIISGTKEGHPHITIIELKQWSDVRKTEMDAMVGYWVGKNYIENEHPSYQALGYKHLLKNFNQEVSNLSLTIETCSYLHNCSRPSDIEHPFYDTYVKSSPVFLKEDRQAFTRFLESGVDAPELNDVLFRLSNAGYSPTQELADTLTTMLAGNQAFMLIGSQKVIFEKILYSIKNQPQQRKKVFVVQGGPGTGKSVVAINLLARSIIDLHKNARYVTKNQAPRAVFEAKLTDSYSRSEISTLFTGSGSFVTTPQDQYDVLVVDEAHRLVKKSGMFSNRGENQVQEIINAAHVSIFFIDEAQQVTWKDFGSVSEIQKWAKHYSADVEEFELDSQFRCRGSDGYLAWLDNTLQIRSTANVRLQSYDFPCTVYDDPNQMRTAVLSKNTSEDRARLVAGYCWPWRSKLNPNAFDIEFPEHAFQMQWNLKNHGGTWIIHPGSVEQVGCIHTAQGLELHHVGVIIGPDLVVRDGQVITSAEARTRDDASIKGYKKAYETDPEAAKRKADLIIKNTYRTLMSRGLKSCSIYSNDPETRRYFQERLG